MTHPRAGVAGLLALTALAACADSPPPGTSAYAAAQEERRHERQVDAVRDSMADIPDWYLAPPVDDNDAVYAPGTAISADLQLAVDKAVIGAKRALADRIGSRLSSKLKEFLSESGAAGDARVMAESERVTNNLITEVNLSGYSVAEKKVVPAGSQFRAYVLIRYPQGEADRRLLDQVRHDDLLDSKLRASKAFQELEHGIQSARPPAPPPPAPAAKPTDDRA